jgi:hypothetical protein
MLDPLTLGELGRRVTEMALAAWEKDRSLAGEVAEFHHLVGAAVKLADPEERRRQVSPLLNPLQSLLHRVGTSHERAHAVHLALAAAYAGLGEEALQFHHLNRACDRAIRVMQTAWWASTRTAYRRQRDQLIGLLGDRRETLIG